MKKAFLFLVLIMLLVVACGDGGSGGPAPRDEVIQWAPSPTPRRPTPIPTQPPGSALAELGVHPKWFTKPSSGSGPTAQVDEVWLEHSTWRGETKGMVIHVNFSIHDFQGRSGRAVAYFYFDDGRALEDFNGQYKTVDGSVSVGKDFVPRYEKARFKDFELFMPYDELHMAKGKFSLKLFVGIWDMENVNGLEQSEWVHFTLTSN